MSFNCVPFPRDIARYSWVYWPLWTVGIGNAGEGKTNDESVGSRAVLGSYYRQENPILCISAYSGLVFMYWKSYPNKLYKGKINVLVNSNSWTFGWESGCTLQLQHNCVKECPSIHVTAVCFWDQKGYAWRNFFQNSTKPERKQICLFPEMKSSVFSFLDF